MLLSDSDLVINLPLEDVLRRHIDSGADMTGITIPPMFNKNLCEIYFNRNDLLCQSK